VTGDATAGIGRHELIDTRPYARAWHFHILNQRTLYGLPRKFNVGFDGGGAIPTLGGHQRHRLQAVEVEDGASVAAGVWFKLVVGGSPGIGIWRARPAPSSSPAKPPRSPTRSCALHCRGRPHHRTKARQKYVLDRYVAEAAVLNGFLAKVSNSSAARCARRGKTHPAASGARRQAHIGAHPQKQPVFTIRRRAPGRKMSCAQIRALAAIARDLGRWRSPPHCLREPC